MASTEKHYQMSGAMDEDELISMRTHRYSDPLGVDYELVLNLPFDVRSIF
jgi:hypothetical protein